MKLVKRPNHKVHEELPGYYTVYGEDERSIGVIVTTAQEGVYWFVGDSEKLDAEEADKGTLGELAEKYGEPHTLPIRPETPRLEVYESPTKTVQRLSYEDAFISKAALESASLEVVRARDKR